MRESDYAKLPILVETEDYNLAKDICHAALASGEDWQFWQTQLGYLSFLDDRNGKSWFDDAPDIFASLVARYPADANAHFWLGYIYDIVLNNLEKARQELNIVLKLNSNHAYAKLVLAGITAQEEGISLLEEVLSIQPTNFRALKQFADALTRTKRNKEALEILVVLIHQRAYVENSYGIMNKYMNDVLTGATWEARMREEARMLIQEIEERIN